MKNQKTLVGILIIGYLLMVGLLTAVIAFARSPDQFFFNLATAIMLSWIITIIIFYIWAMYYFHIHLAVEDKARLDDDQKPSEKSGVALGDKLLNNPHFGETLGLPNGTIRGTIALSLLIAGLSLLIASFEMNNTFNANALFVDNFEFIKTAFLMVIAFYFGSKSLSAITSGNRGVYRPDDPGDGNAPGAGAEDDTIGSGVDNNNRSQPQSGAVWSENSLPSATVTNGVQATAIKNALKADGNVETTDTGSTEEFDDHEAVG